MTRMALSYELNLLKLGFYAAGGLIIFSHKKEQSREKKKFWAVFGP